MLLTVTTTPINPIITLDGMTFAGGTGLQIRQNAVGGSQYSVLFVNEGAGTLYWANGTTADTSDGIAVGPGETACVTIDEAKDLSFVSDSSATLRVAYVQDGFQVPFAGSGASGPTTVEFDTIYERQRIDETPSGNVEYTERIGVDQSGIATVLARFLADGTVYAPVGTQEFTANPACCFCVDKIPTTFKVNGFALAQLKINPGTGDLFWPDDNAPGAFGVVLTIDDSVETTSQIISTEWVSIGGGLDPLISDNASAGTNGRFASSVFIRTHDTDGTTPLLTFNSSFNCRIATSEGVVFSAMSFVGSSSFSGGRLISHFATAGIRVTQTTGSEVLYEMVAYQPSVLTNSDLTNYSLNVDPTSPSFNIMSLVEPCGGFIDFPVADRQWNLIGGNGGLLSTCDQGMEFTNALASFPGSTTRIKAVGTDTAPPALPGYLLGDATQGPTLTTGGTVFSYDKN